MKELYWGAITLLCVVPVELLVFQNKQANRDLPKYYIQKVKERYKKFVHSLETFSTCLCCCKYLHTPWCPPAGQSPRGTCQSSALCVGKNLTCTWCRSLCWSRSHSSLSCTLEEERKTEETHQGRSNPLIWSWLKAQGFGEGGSWKDYTVSPAEKVGDALVNHFYLRLNCISKSLFCSTDFSFIFLVLFRVSKSTVWRHNSRDCEKLCLSQWIALTSKSGYWIQTHKLICFQLTVCCNRKNTSH